ncbi:MAG: ABC transporter ATP-binding protein [Spirochaetaceae bacterium]|nr:ABC transporter ATP-binding protein [Spirochaetaceae bacterium]
MSETVIKVENLYKEYKLGVISHGTLYKDMQSWWAKIRGKEDPNSLISTHHGEDAEKTSFLALNDVSFEIKAGDRVGIIGKNGAGKSTLLKILSRITSPTRGSVTIHGKVGSLLEVGTGFHQELTGRENIFLNGSILGMNKREISRKMDEIIDFAGIEKHIDTPVKRYSSGMMVRLGFAVAAHLDTDILIADEVLAVGDAEFQRKALAKMGDLSTGEGRTVLFVSHNMGAVERLCNIGLILHNGVLIDKSDDIKYSIKKYLNVGQEDTTKLSYEWINNGQVPNNQWFKPISFFITDDNMNILKDTHSNDKDLWINIKGIIKENDSAFCIGYALYSEDNALLYWSYQTDVPQAEWPKFKLGEFHLRSKIPKRFLNEGTYRVEFICSLHCRQWILDPEVNAPAIFFEINGGLSDSPYLFNKRPGVLSPIHAWEIVSEDQ